MQLSVWEQETFFAPRDIIIVGAGVVGLWCAYELKKKYPAKDILILERGMTPSGASTKNAGFACFGSPTELLSDKKTMGEDEMWQTVAMRYRGIEKIKKILGEENIDYEPCGGYECLTNVQHDIAVLEKELPSLNDGLQKITDIPDVFRWANEKLDEYRFKNFDALIENKLEGSLHSGKLLLELTKKVQEMGVMIMTSMTVSDWEEQDGMIKVKTKEYDFLAKHLILCTNAFTNDISKELSITPARGQIILTSVIPALSFKGTFHFDEGFYYFRNLGNRVLLGGARNIAFEEEQTTQIETSEKIQNKLEQFLSKYILPNQPYTIEKRWSGIMGFTKDKRPVIYHSPNKQVHTVIACNGMGIAMSPIIAEDLAESIVF